MSCWVKEGEISHLKSMEFIVSLLELTFKETCVTGEEYAHKAHEKSMLCANKSPNKKRIIIFDATLQSF
jgi:hypothetical protein